MANLNDYTARIVEAQNALYSSVLKNRQKHDLEQRSRFRPNVETNRRDIVPGQHYASKRATTAAAMPTTVSSVRRAPLLSNSRSEAPALSSRFKTEQLRQARQGNERSRAIVNGSATSPLETLLALLDDRSERPALQDAAAAGTRATVLGSSSTPFASHNHYNKKSGMQIHGYPPSRMRSLERPSGANPTIESHALTAGRVRAPTAIHPRRASTDAVVGNRYTRAPSIERNAAAPYRSQSVERCAWDRGSLSAWQRNEHHTSRSRSAERRVEPSRIEHALSPATKLSRSEYTSPHWPVPRIGSTPKASGPVHTASADNVALSSSAWTQSKKYDIKSPAMISEESRHWGEFRKNLLEEADALRSRIRAQRGSLSEHASLESQPNANAHERKEPLPESASVDSSKQSLQDQSPRHEDHTSNKSSELNDEISDEIKTAYRIKADPSQREDVKVASECAAAERAKAMKMLADAAAGEQDVEAASKQFVSTGNPSKEELDRVAQQTAAAVAEAHASARARAEEVIARATKLAIESAEEAARKTAETSVEIGDLSGAMHAVGENAEVEAKKLVEAEVAVREEETRHRSIVEELNNDAGAMVKAYNNNLKQLQVTFGEVETMRNDAQKHYDEAVHDSKRLHSEAMSALTAKQGSIMRELDEIISSIRSKHRRAKEEHVEAENQMRAKTSAIIGDLQRDTAELEHKFHADRHLTKEAADRAKGGASASSYLTDRLHKLETSFKHRAGELESEMLAAEGRGAELLTLEEERYRHFIQDLEDRAATSTEELVKGTEHLQTAMGEVESRFSNEIEDAEDHLRQVLSDYDSAKEELDDEHAQLVDLLDQTIVMLKNKLEEEASCHADNVDLLKQKYPQAILLNEDHPSFSDSRVFKETFFSTIRGEGGGRGSPDMLGTISFAADPPGPESPFADETPPSVGGLIQTNEARAKVDESPSNSIYLKTSVFEPIANDSAVRSQNLSNDVVAISTLAPTEEIAWDLIRKFCRQDDGARAVSVFRKFDKEKSGSLGLQEFGGALKLMGIKTTPQIVKLVFRSEVIDDFIDAKGRLQFEGFVKELNTSKAHMLSYSSPSKIKTSFSTPEVDADGSNSGHENVLDVSIDVASQRTENAAKLIWKRMRDFAAEGDGLRAVSLFEKFDKGGSGRIDVAEFRAALMLMGITGVSVGMANAVIQSADADFSDKVNYRDMLKALKSSSGHAQASHQQRAQSDWRERSLNETVSVDHDDDNDDGNETISVDHDDVPRQTIATKAASAPLQAPAAVKSSRSTSSQNESHHSYNTFERLRPSGGTSAHVARVGGGEPTVESRSQNSATSALEEFGFPIIDVSARPLDQASYLIWDRLRSFAANGPSGNTSPGGSIRSPSRDEDLSGRKSKRFLAMLFADAALQPAAPLRADAFAAGLARLNVRGVSSKLAAQLLQAARSAGAGTGTGKGLDFDALGVLVAPKAKSPSPHKTNPSPPKLFPSQKASYTAPTTNNFAGDSDEKPAQLTDLNAAEDEPNGSFDLDNTHWTLSSEVGGDAIDGEDVSDDDDDCATQASASEASTSKAAAVTMSPEVQAAAQALVGRLRALISREGRVPALRHFRACEDGTGYMNGKQLSTALDLCFGSKGSVASLEVAIAIMPLSDATFSKHAFTSAKKEKFDYMELFDLCAPRESRHNTAAAHDSSLEMAYRRDDANRRILNVGGSVNWPSLAPEKALSHAEDRSGSHSRRAEHNAGAVNGSNAFSRSRHRENNHGTSSSQYREGPQPLSDVASAVDPSTGEFLFLHLDNFSTEEAAHLIWERMQAFAKHEGGLRPLELFREMDKDRSGKVDHVEFGKALQRLHVVGASKKAIKAVIKTADPNGDGKLEYKELLPKLKDVRARPAKPVFHYDDHGHHIDDNHPRTRSASPVHNSSKTSPQNSPPNHRRPLVDEEAPNSGSTHFRDTLPRSHRDVRSTSPTTPPRPIRQPHEENYHGEESAEHAALLAMPVNDAIAVVWHRIEEYAKQNGPLRTLELFREFDKDRNGKVSCAEFGSALKRMGLDCPPSVVKVAIRTADSNGDGKLEYKDLLAKLKEFKKKPAPTLFKYDDSGRMRSPDRPSSSPNRQLSVDTGHGNADQDMLGLVSGMLSPGEPLLSDSPRGPPPNAPLEELLPPVPTDTDQPWRIGEKVEVKDDCDDEWEKGVVSNIESDGAPRVTKDGYDKGYIWDQCRSIATLEAQSGASSAVATVRANEDEKEDEGAVITWHIGQRVEVKDDGTEWEIGTVIAVDEDDKKARVRKDGYDSGYFWDHCRVLASDTKDEDERSQASSSAAAASSPESEGASKKKGWFSWARKSSNRDKSTSSTPDLENQATSQAAVAQSEEEKKSQLSVQEEEEEDKHEVEEDVDDEDDKDGEDEDEEEDGYEVEENATSSKNDDEEESEEVEEVESAKEEVAQDILRRMRLYAREHGGMRATELFETFDKDNSGKIEIRELRAAMLLMGIEDATIQDAKEIMSIIDKDGDGKLDYHELLKALKDNIAKEQEEEEEESEVETSKEAAAQDILRRMRLYAREHGGMRATELFETFDKDKNGTIEIREFRAAMILMGIENVTLQDAKDIMAIIDCDGDGKLDYNELLKALKDNIARDQKEEEQTGDEDEDQEEEDDEEEEEDDEEDDDDDEEEEGEEDDDDDEEEDVDEEEEENEDGDEETAEKDSATAVSSAYEPSDSDSVKPQAAPERLSVGARVEGLFDEGDEWFPGKITKVWPDGRYDLLYDDGDEEVKVPGALVRLDARPFSEKYTLENVLGEGSFSVVRKAKRNSDGAVFAVKCIQRSQLSALETANLQREIDIMRDMHHPHVVGLVDVFENEKDTIYLVQDFVEGGELFDRIQAKTVYNEAEARVVVELMLSTLAHLHSRHVVHRDLKPENILLVSSNDDTNIKLADFGFAKHISDLKGDLALCGTPDYIAPEILLHKPHGSSVDIWALGIITYILLGGYPPFYDESDDQGKLFRKIVKGTFVFDSPFWDPVSDSAKDFIRQMLTMDPNHRPSATTLLRHPWIKEAHQEGGTDGSSADLSGAVNRLKKWQANRRLKGAMKTVKAVARLSKMAGAAGAFGLKGLVEQASGNNQVNDGNHLEAAAARSSAFESLSSKKKKPPPLLPRASASSGLSLASSSGGSLLFDAQASSAHKQRSSSQSQSSQSQHSTTSPRGLPPVRFTSPKALNLDDDDDEDEDGGNDKDRGLADSLVPEVKSMEARLRALELARAGVSNMVAQERRHSSRSHSSSSSSAAAAAKAQASAAAEQAASSAQAAAARSEAAEMAAFAREALAAEREALLAARQAQSEGEMRRLRSEHDRAMVRFREERLRRRALYEKLVALQGNIRVYVRVRPPTIEDTAAEAKVMAPEHHPSSGINDPSHVRVATSFFEDEPELIEVTAAKHYGRAHSGAPQKFEFDTVFSPSASQEDVFSETVRPLLPQFVLRGTDVCVFAYGQTGSGKTYTMSGKRSAERGGFGKVPNIIHGSKTPSAAHANNGNGDGNSPNGKPSLTAAQLLASDANFSPEPLDFPQSSSSLERHNSDGQPTHSPSGRLVGKSAREAAAADDDEWTGLSMRALREAFAIAQDDVTSGATYAFAVEYVEIYNETVRDLLAGVNPENGAAEGSSLAFASPPGTPRRSNSVKPALNRRASLDIRQDTANGATFVPGLSKHVVTSAGEVAALVAFGDARRMVSGHAMNDQSSRSHAILTFICTRTDRGPSSSFNAMMSGPPNDFRRGTSSGSSGVGSGSNGGRPNHHHTGHGGGYSTPKGGPRLSAFPESPDNLHQSDALSITSHDSELSSVTDGSAGRPRRRHSNNGMGNYGSGHQNHNRNSQGVYGGGVGGGYDSSGHDKPGTVSVSRLQLVDLAGSERVAKSEVVGDRLKEAQAINKSLACLGDVIGALSRKMTSGANGNASSSHVPFRDSKLTYFLKGSLSGHARVAMLCNASPAAVHADETLCSLKFAARCRNVELKSANGMGPGLGTRRDSSRNNSANNAGGVRSRSTSLSSRGKEVLRSSRG